METGWFAVFLQTMLCDGKSSACFAFVAVEEEFKMARCFYQRQPGSETNRGPAAGRKENMREKTIGGGGEGGRVGTGLNL